MASASARIRAVLAFAGLIFDFDAKAPGSLAGAFSVLAAASLTRRAIARTGESTADEETVGQKARRPARGRRRVSKALAGGGAAIMSVIGGIAEVRDLRLKRRS